MSKHTSTFTTDEINIANEGVISGKIDIDYSFDLDPESDGAGEFIRNYIAVNDFNICEVRIHKLDLSEGQFRSLVGDEEVNRIEGVLLDKIQEMKVEL